MNNNIILVISGPSGCGKGTVVNSIMQISDEFALSVSATTRKPREGEKYGESYYFITEEQFEKKIASGDMLEYTKYLGNYYGTPKSGLQKKAKTKNVILEIEVNGGTNVKKQIKDAVLIFLLPPDLKTLEKRLRERGTETEEVIRGRLEKFREELAYIDSYDYIVVNEEGAIEKTAEKIINIINSERMRTERCKEVKEKYYE